MLRRTPEKSQLHQALEAAFPWMLFGILIIGLLINAGLTIMYRTEERLIEKQACRDGVASEEVDCSIYFGPRWTVEPINETTLLAAP